MQIDAPQEAAYDTPNQPDGIPGWHEGIPVFRIYTCGPFTIEMLVEVPEGDPVQAHYAKLPPERLSGRGSGSAQKMIKLLLSQESRYASKDWLRTHLREGEEVYTSNKRLENILSYLRCHLLPLSGGKKLHDLLLYVKGTHESGDGYRLAGYPLIWIDVDAFFWNVKQACLKERFSEDPYVYWQRAYDLASRGSFLLEEAASDWAKPLREAVDDQVCQCVHALSRFYLARFGQSGEEDVLRMLLPYCRLHRRDEDALRSLLELLTRRGRYQEVVEWYEQLEKVLVEAGLDKSGTMRIPQPLTADITNFARLKLREAMATKADGVDKPFNLTSALSQDNHLSNLPFSVTPLAHVIEFSSMQQVELFGTVSTEQELLVPYGHGVLVPDSLSIHNFPLVEGTYRDCATWFSERLAYIIAFVTQRQRRMHATDFEKILDRELRMFDEIKTMFDPDTYFLSRRSALLVIASLPKGLLGLLQQPQKAAFIEEEFLPACAASVTACWYLLNGREFASVERALSRYMPFLVGWARRVSTYQRPAAYLASQACLLLGFIELHRLQFQQRVAYCREAVKHGREAGESPLLVKALTQLGNAYYDQGLRAEMLQAYQEAKYFMKDVPHSLQSKVLMGLAHAYAQQGQAAEALDTISEARGIFPSVIEDVPAFLSADDGEYSLILFEGWIRLDLGKHYPGKEYNEQAAKVLAQIDSLQTTSLVPERYRHEIINRRAQAAIASGDLDVFCDFTLQSANFLQVMHSGKRRQELIANYKDARARWPHEARVNELADVLL